jgi:hypothetical protein
LRQNVLQFGAALRVLRGEGATSNCGQGIFLELACPDFQKMRFDEFAPQSKRHQSGRGCCCHWKQECVVVHKEYRNYSILLVGACAVGALRPPEFGSNPRESRASARVNLVQSKAAAAAPLVHHGELPFVHGLFHQSPGC